jgi:L-histidine N-alpha-methyltransferase
MPETRSEPTQEQDPRLSVVRLPTPAEAPDFASDVRAGLSATPKFLYPKYFYDELGSILFEAICALPEYYVTRAESSILAARAGEIVAELDRPVQLVELGSGSSIKTRYVIEALLARQKHLEYTPIDISESAIAGSCDGLLRSYPELSIRAFVGDYLSTFAALPQHERGLSRGTLLVLFLGSTIGNLDPEDGVDLLSAVRARLSPGDALLLGTDLVKPEDVLVPAYDDALGVTAAFNLNLLVRINRELGGRFDLAAFRHRAVWNRERSRVEMHLVSRVEQRVAIEALDLEVSFAEGEAILSECSYKFDQETTAKLATASGFELARRWTDAERRFGSNLLVAV